MNVPQELVLAGGGVVLIICAAVAGVFRRHGQHARPGRDHDDDITVVSQPDRDDPDTWVTEGDVTGFTPAAADLEQPTVTIVRLDPETLQPLPTAPVRIGPYAPTAGCWTPHTDRISDEDVEGLRQRFAAVQGNRPTILPDLPDGHLTVTGPLWRDPATNPYPHPDVTDSEFENTLTRLVAIHGHIPPPLQEVIAAGGRFTTPTPRPLPPMWVTDILDGYTDTGLFVELLAMKAKAGATT
jgi:hypothetical protein